VTFIHRELIRKQRRQWWSTRIAKSFKQSVLNEIHTMRILKVQWYDKAYAIVLFKEIKPDL
jgi:hypothetical protein